MENEYSSIFDVLNGKLNSLGFPELALVNPNSLLEQKKNAHYFTPEKFKQLVKNVQNDGFLASVPLVKRDGDRLRIIDGTHRVNAAKESKLDYILVFIYEPKSEDEAVSKQLSFNALVGKDDQVLLAELFNSIRDIDLKMASGLNSEITKINYHSLNFKISSFKELNFLFIPTDVENYDKLYEEIVNELQIKSSSDVRLADVKYFDKFTEVLRKVKKVENIKSNSTALLRILELAKLQLKETV